MTGARPKERWVKRKFKSYYENKRRRRPWKVSSRVMEWLNVSVAPLTAKVDKGSRRLLLEEDRFERFRGLAVLERQLSEKSSLFRVRSARAQRSAFNRSNTYLGFRFVVVCVRCISKVDETSRESSPCSSSVASLFFLNLCYCIWVCIGISDTFAHNRWSMVRTRTW